MVLTGRGRLGHLKRVTEGVTGAGMNQIDLKDRCAVVTGGAQGIGEAVAARFVANGAKVSLWDRDAKLLELARAQLAELVRTGLARPPSRQPTKPSRSARRRRVADKRHRSETKKLRRRPEAE